MMRLRSRLLVAASVAVLSASAAGVGAQTRLDVSPVGPEVPPVRPEAPPQIGPPLPDGSAAPSIRRAFTRLRDVVRVGGPFELAADDSAQNVTVIVGDAVVAGRVEHDVVVVFGDATIAASAVVNGSVSVVGGDAHVADGASIARDFTVVGGRLDAPPGIATRGDSFVLDTRAFGGRLEWIVDWVKHGLLVGRLFVPGLSWMWLFAGIWLFLSVLVALLLEGPVRRAAAVARQRPVSACAVGLASLVLLGPLSVLLAASVVGILVVPFLLLAAVAAWTIGRVAVARWIGSRVIAEGEDARKAVALRSVLIGLAVIGTFYALPVLGVAAWAGFGVFGMGAAVLTFVNAYRRENPIPEVPLPPAAPSSAAVPAFGSAQEEPPMATSHPIPVPLASSTVPPDWRGQGLIAFPHARFLDRLAAAALDLILVLLVYAFLDTDRGNLVFLMLLAYHVIFLMWKGTTVGGIIMQLRVVRTDGAPVRGADALVRGLACVFSTVVLGLGFLWILRDPDRQAWHDRIAGTYVVKVPREWPV